jgi:signal transduction histidine kinase
MTSSPSLRQRILRWLFLYAVLLSAAVMAGGYVIHERVEHLAWDSLLRAELDYFGQRSDANPSYRWHDTDTLRMFGVEGAPPLPPDLAALPPGLHDDRSIDGVHSVVLRDRVGGVPVALALDLTEFEGIEAAITLAVAGGTVAVILMLGLLVMWGLGRAIAPLSDLARQVARLQPTGDSALAVAPGASGEMVVIARAFNDYLGRARSHVERERAFIASASHELRTPVAVIAGAAELVLGRPDTPPLARVQVARIHRTARSVEQLITLLLMLARDPSRLASLSDELALDELLPETIEDHRHLTRGKDLALVLEPPPACVIVAPPGIVQAAIGNLLRNAIEHSDRGEIRVRLQPDATVVIEDAGHGMSPEEISAIYASVARGGSDGGGIGLDLIARLCEHLGWDLAFDSTPGRGTTTTLRLGRSLRTPVASLTPRPAGP